MPAAVFLGLLAELLFVGYIDFKTKKISNLWSLANIGLFVVLYFIYPKYYILNWSVLLFPLTFLMVGYMLFIFNVMGAGDSKYLSTLFLLIPLNMQEHAFLSLAYTTIVVGSISLGLNIYNNFASILEAIKNKDTSNFRKFFGEKFTFAPVILISWIWFGWKLKDYIN